MLQRAQPAAVLDRACKACFAAVQCASVSPAAMLVAVQRASASPAARFNASGKTSSTRGSTSAPRDLLVCYRTLGSTFVS